MSGDRLLEDNVEQILQKNINIQEPTKEQLLQRIQELEQQLQGNAPDKSPSELIQIFIWELLGTGVFSYGIVVSKGNDLILSLYLFAAIFLVGRFTGGHVNPAVSMSFYSSNEISAFTMRIYWAAQISGAILGALTAFIIVGRVTSPFIPNQSIQWIVADFGGELLGTFVFCLFIHIQVHKETQLTDNNLLGIGMIATGLYFGRNLTVHSGGCLNPAMGVGLQIFQALQDNQWDRLSNLWIFIFAPLSGASLATEFYRQVYCALLPKKH